MLLIIKIAVPGASRRCLVVRQLVAADPRALALVWAAVVDGPALANTANAEPKLIAITTGTMMVAINRAGVAD